MEKRIDKLHKIQKVIDKIVSATNELINIARKEKNNNLKRVLKNYSMTYASLSLLLSLALIKEIPKANRKDEMDEKFSKLMEENFGTNWDKDDKNNHKTDK